MFCKVNGCKAKVSRGKTGTGKANLSNAPMMQYLKLKHPKENAEFCKETVAEKRKADEEDNDLETGADPLFNLRTSSKRQDFLHQARVSDWCLAGSSRQESPYDIHDLRARERHKGILMMVILDLRPWNIVNDPKLPLINFTGVF